ncbi:MAG: ROK family protein [Candidatus Neomarinimicrobiota bacterium]|jgi:glucokinase|nr:ROK family protein [Candidatus Neomarinimicrobiota bacterium]MDD3965864.1 ROK family protein [Candidatus Neomarinimicrobiota bacterium]MDX9780070.1 ROK family protein [bacterium]
MKYYVGIDFGGTGIKIGIIDENGKILIKDSFDTDPSKRGEDIARHIAECTEKVMSDSGLPREAIQGVGIGSPGLLNPETGQLKVVVNVPNMNDVFITRILSDILGKPAFLDNDVNAMSLGEFYYGAGKGLKHVIALTLGTGVGGGIILNGELYRGASFTAGELGHMSIARDGKSCPCGNSGCLERYVGRDGIIERFMIARNKGLDTNIEKYLDKGKITPKAIAMAAEAGDKLSIKVLEETGEILGAALATLVNALNPQAIIIGGGIANAGEFILGPARKTMLRLAYAIPAKVVKVLKAELGNDAGLVGSASLVVANLS